MMPVTDVQVVKAYRHGSERDLRWFDPADKSRGLDLDATDAMYVLEPNVEYRLELCEETVEVLVMTNPEHKRARGREFLRNNGLKLKSKGVRRVNLTGWDLVNADLGGADLTGAVARSATANRANLTEAKLDGADMSYITLTEASLYGASVKEAKFELATMTSVNLKRADARGADFNHANAIDANMEFAKLDGANFVYADLSNASLVGASLRNADLTSSRLARASIDGAKFTRIFYHSSRQRPSPASLGISGRSLMTAERLNANHKNDLTDELSSFQFDSPSDDEEEIRQRRRGEEIRTKPSSSRDEKASSTDVSIDSRRVSWLSSANQLRNAYNASQDWIDRTFASLLMDMEEGLEDDLRSAYDAANAQLKDIVLEEVATASSRSNQSSSKNAVADRASVGTGSESSSATKKMWKKSSSAALSMSAFQKASILTKSFAEREAKLMTFRKLNLCLRQIAEVTGELSNHNEPGALASNKLTRNTFIKALMGLRHRLRAAHIRRETEYCLRERDGALSSLLLMWRLAPVSPAVLVRHIDEIEYLCDQLDKIREPVTVLNWSDVLDSWMALADLMPKIRVRRGQLILEAIFASPPVVRGLSWGFALRGIQGATTNPPSALIHKLKGTSVLSFVSFTIRLAFLTLSCALPLSPRKKKIP